MHDVFCIGAENQTIINQTFVPDTNSRAYTVTVEAGAKLLEFDIIRAHVDAQEKSLVATLQHETFTSTAGKALGVLGPLEQLAHGFDDVIPAFLVLQSAVSDSSVTDASVTDAVKTQISHALNGLVAVLAAPEVLHAVLPQPELVGASYRDAMTYAPTAVFIKTIQGIAHRKFMLHYCDADNQIVNQQQLPNDAHLFYGVVKQTVVNMFGNLMKDYVIADLQAADNNDSKRINPCAVLYFDSNKVWESYFEAVNVNKCLKETKDSNEFVASANLITKKIDSAFVSIAKKRNANSGIANNNHPAYVNPECDVTQEVIDQLNKEYFASKRYAAFEKQQSAPEIKVEAKTNVFEPAQTVKPSFPPQEMLHQAIIHDSAEEVKEAVKAGANVMIGKNHRNSLYWRELC